MTTAGGILNLGISTNNTQAGLNDTTGAVATLNAAGVTKITTPAFTKSTGARLLVMEVKTAAITAGSVNIIVKLAKTI